MFRYFVSISVEKLDLDFEFQIVYVHRFQNFSVFIYYVPRVDHNVFVRLQGFSSEVDALAD